MSDRERCVCTLHRALHSMCHHHWILLLVCVFFFSFHFSFFSIISFELLFLSFFFVTKVFCCFYKSLLYVFLCLISFPLNAVCAFQLFKRSVSNCFIGLFFAFIRFFNALCANRERLFRITCENHQREFQKRLFSDETLAKCKNLVRRQSPMYLWCVCAYVCVYVRARDCNALFFYLKFIPSLHIPFNMYLLRVSLLLPLMFFF